MPAPRTYATIALLFLASFVAAGCTGGDRPATPRTTPGPAADAASSTPMTAVSAKPFGACLASIDVPNWKVTRGDDGPKYRGRVANVGVWHINWNGPDEGAEPYAPKVATVVVLPTTVGAKRFRDEFPRTDKVTGETFEVHNNVFVSSYDGTSINPALPPKAVAGINQCEQSATAQVLDAHPRTTFKKCRVPPVDPDAIAVEAVYVRGAKCAEVSPMVKRGAEGGGSWCEAFGTGMYSCASENVCCGIFVLYVGSSSVEAIIKYGI